LRSVKAEIIINKPLKTVYEFVDDKENKLKTDKHFDDGYVVRKITKDLDLTYQKYNGKLGFSPRDYYILIQKQLDSDNALLLGTSYISENYKEKKNVVRANLYFGAYVFQKIDANRTLINYYYLDDIKVSAIFAKMNLSSVASNIIEVKKYLEN